MHTHNLSPWQHEHVFNTGNQGAERSTRLVMWITLATMVVEIGAGWWFNSMALLADGWHMSSHALAIGLATLAYGAARRYAKDSRFAFGTWKIEVLGGFASAILLLGVAALMVAGSVERLFSPQPIAYREAIVVAMLGLLVNAACALILGRAHHGHGHDHGHAHGHAHGHDHGHDHGHHHGEDLNLKSAYMHVVADAATSLLAIVALVGGWLYGWRWLDPMMGIAGAVLVAVWARGLLAQTGKVLLDREMDHPVVDEIREVVEQDADPRDETRIADLHVWRVGKAVYACAITVVTHSATLSAEDIRRRLAVHEEIVHSTIEVHRCPE
ncbi:CDF family Co(II)/Ni(II) efflux transporter DmeF [Variovorax sp. OV329]|uniref:CDF family Co(II)/Ni(II) efflux transporter DmeF n=1 Tax=Variovorax sp. OV329 TaxID=1882825 RepID=UPI0008F0C166|nr:CDF family Co(II)/Ni(II) efflux transporter DmeF [Variovorax sp. OV329]SFL86634.1 cation diffusion facilitator family transporter [Variovorax sp. OV329]